MTPQPKITSRAAPAPTAPKGVRRWLLFVHQLPPTSSNLRVQTWRRLQQFGAIPVKQAVYVLPDTPNTREDFEWLIAQVKAAGGDAEVFIGGPAHTWSDDALVDEFRRSRQEAYGALAQDIEHALNRVDGKKRRGSERAPPVNRLLEGFRQRLAALERIDFFGSAGRDRAAQLVNEFGKRVSAQSRRPASTPPPPTTIENYQGRLWVTRPRPGVDRMSSAWLIRRFIDPQAQFGFAPDQESAPEGSVPFDMFGVEFTHHGDNCTFETLCSVFGIRDAAVTRLAAIVHDLDLKDARFGAAEVGTVGAMIDGLQLGDADDDALLAQGMTLFESLYRSFEQTARTAGPRPLAKPRNRTTTRSGKPSSRRRSP
jgi:hypothetical protein